MKLLLIDDHQLFSSSFRLAIEKFEIVRKVVVLNNPQLISNYLLNNEIDVVLLDINLGNYNGLVVGETLLKRFPNIPLVFLTGFDFEEYQFQANLMGATGFFNKNISPVDLVSNLCKIVNEGTKFIEPEGSILTNKEKEVLNYLSEGKTHIQIAENLHISRRTVNNHVQSIHDKFNVASTSEAIIKGVRLGIISIIK